MEGEGSGLDTKAQMMGGIWSGGEKKRKELEGSGRERKEKRKEERGRRGGVNIEFL